MIFSVEIWVIQKACVDNPFSVQDYNGVAGFDDKVEEKILLLVCSRHDKLVFP